MSYLDNNGLSYLWSKLKATFVRMRTATVTLSSTGWVLSGGYYIQSATVTGVTATNNVVIEASNSIEAYSQSTNSIGFRVSVKPTANVNVKVMIFT